MAPEFIFAQDIDDLVREGKSTLEVGEATRISAAALDLIREHGLEVVIRPVTEPPAGGEAVAPTAASPAEFVARTCAAAGQAVGPEPGPPPLPASQPAVEEEELERIVDRVIARFKALRGQAPGPQPDQETEAPGTGAGDDLIICRCEEITRGEIKKAIRSGLQTVSGVNRITRAGMGLCQGQTCERLVTQILAQELGRPPAELEPLTARAPVRPLPLSVFATG